MHLLFRVYASVALAPAYSIDKVYILEAARYNVIKDSIFLIF